jgi:uncharacterized protein DUF2213
MPIQQCTLPGGGTGWRWGQHGKCYADRADAEKQAQAIYASGYAGDRLALDRASVRSFDEYGHLTVSSTPISKAMVCPYRGDEIPGWQALGLDRGRIYRLFRAPEELAKAASSFDGKPLLLTHRPVTATDHADGLVVGAIGSGVTFKPPYLMAPLSVWTQDAIDLIESGEQKQLSAGYGYDPDMTPGTYQGAPFDGVMRNIRGNHVALVEVGRAGADVVVGDSQLKESDMATLKGRLSLKAAMARGALAAYIAPKLAQDAKIDLRSMLLGTTARNWPTRKFTIATDLTKATEGKLAQDADLGDLMQLLDLLDGEGNGEQDDGLGIDKPGVDDPPTDPASDPDPAADPAGDPVDPAADPPKDPPTDVTDEPVAKVLAFLKDLLRPEDVAIVQHILQPAKAADPVPEEVAPDADPTVPPKKDEPPMDPTKKPPAMDAAMVSRIEQQTIARMNAIREAERIVRPLIGELDVPQKSADAVYKLALDAAEVDLTGVPTAAYGAMAKMLIAQKAATAPASPTVVAMDAAGNKKFLERFPHANRLRQH